MEREGPRQIRIEQIPEDPWAKTSWKNVYGNLDMRDLQKQNIRLSEELGNQTIDPMDTTCMRYLLHIWGEKVADERIIDYVTMLKASQLRWVERQILQPYFLQNELL